MWCAVYMNKNITFGFAGCGSDLQGREIQYRGRRDTHRCMQI